jgi:CheY-like chemotaxis protein
VAIYATQGAEIDAIITDMMMPVMDGPATIRVLRKMNPEVRIIAASGLASNADTAYGGLGLKHFLPKPYTSDVMLQALRKILVGK